MKKILIAAIITITATASALGAASSDIHEGVYLRQDVFEAKMDAFMAEIRLMNEQLRSELNSRIDATNARIDVTNARLDELKTAVYWGIGLLGLLITLAAAAPYIVKVLQSINIPKPTLTIEDVERLIDAKLQSKNAQ
ncbi:MAG: hypothetical protein IJQ15_08180 [Synergistaceae bacterium]|nr:hypothetical protein [Synergistaceae bacterium]MBQ4401805.1 hypothetical protein [Synergistaceae bacterium]MBQ6418707.1 hypothetical protein [Synergistaceae bacterium]MBQ6982386.1 hypothetical protein [Synergistaceae bacterium]MBR0248416.1 hypothetical protein [Synergistaceae bacterium]